MDRNLIVFIWLILILINPVLYSNLDQLDITERFKKGDMQQKQVIVADLKEDYRQIDSGSLKEITNKLLNITQDLELKAELINLMSDKYFIENEFELAISGYMQTLQIINSLSPHVEEAHALYSLGEIYNKLDQDNKSIEYLEKAAVVYSGLEDFIFEADIYSEIGYLYDNLIIYDEAMKNYFKALMIYENFENIQGMANSYVNIGNINQSMSHFNQALEYYSKAYDIYETLNDDEGISNCLNNMGIIYDDLGENHKSLSYYLKSLEYARNLGDEAGIATTLNNLGIIYKKLGDFNLSLNSYEQSLDISRELDDTWAIANTMSNIGELYIDYGDYIHGLDFLNKGMDVSKQNNFTDLLMEGYSILAKYYSNIEDFEKAFINYRDFVALKDSIVIESSKRISEIQSIYQNQKHAKEIELLEVKQKLGRNVRLTLLTTSVALVIIIFWLLLLNKRKKKEILKRKKLEKNVLRLAHIVDQAETSIIMTDLSGNIIYANKYIEKLTGYNSTELIGSKPGIFKSGITDEDSYQELWNTINTGQVWKGIFLNRKKNGDLYFEDSVIFPIKDEDGKLINFAAVKKDITDQITAQNDLKASEFRFRTMAKKINEGLMIVENNKVVYINDKFEEITGYGLPELKKQELSDFLSGNDLEQARLLIKDVKDNPAISRNLEFWLKAKDGKNKSLLCGLTHHKIDLTNSSFYLVIADITERKISEEKLLKSLNEKEILIKEIHHRVKNNMQVVSSLLQLQSRYIKDSETLDVFKKSQNRVKSMSLIHEKLYRSDDLANIDFNDYIRKLTRHLLIFFSVDVNRIIVKYDIGEVFLGIVQAIPIGLILNELISNSLKYAFPGKEKGIIIITMKLLDENIFFSIEDDGVGIPESCTAENSESLGLQLINSLSEQLHGKLEWDKTKGTKFTLIFPRSKQL